MSEGDAPEAILRRGHDATRDLSSAPTQKLLTSPLCLLRRY